ncbi:condensation domain-containing protein [Priestia megaterium]|uniref:condensation domain-containing protein n=1 Tax=Priestia megaterium TaxID=1404 RepID=UPI00221F0815|nr:condensation domain-containing protein [Priestia megaterium]
MTYSLNELQKEIALYGLINKTSKKYMLNSIFELPLKADLDRFEKCLLELLNIHPLLKVNFGIFDGEFRFKNNSDFTNEEILKIIRSDEDVREIEEEKIFTEDYDILDDNRLIRTALLTKDNKHYFLMSVHHIIFDVFSGIAFFSQVMDLYNGEISKVELKNSVECSFTKQIEVQQKKLNQDRAVKYFEGKNDILKEFNKSNKIVESNERKLKVMNIKNENYLSLDFRSQSAKIILALAIAIKEQFNMSKIVIGVPVPNRNRHNKNIVSCLVNVLPIYINLDTSYNYEEKINDIKIQLFKNLRFQSFNFISYFRKEVPGGYFPVVFTYYPSDFVFGTNDSKMKGENIFFTECPSTVHIRAKENGVIEIDTLESKKELVDKIEKEISSICG